MNIIEPETRDKIEDLLARGHGIRETAKLAEVAKGTVQKISDGIEYKYFCPILRLSSIKIPCEVNLSRAKEDKENGKRLSYTFEKCLECDGKGLEKKKMQVPEESAGDAGVSIEPIDRQIVDGAELMGKEDSLPASEQLQPEWFTNLLLAFEQRAEGILVALEKATDDKMMAQDGLEILGHLKAQEMVLKMLVALFPAYGMIPIDDKTNWWKMYEKMWDWSAKCME